MGAKMQATSYLPGYYSMRDLNEDYNSCGWPHYNGDKASSNGQYYNGFLERTSAASYPGYDKDAVKQKMLEHEAIFKNQVYELHRLYRVQKELMGEITMKDQHRNRIFAEKSLSSSPLITHISPKDARKWHNHQFPLANYFCATAPIPGVESIISPLNSIKGTSSPTGSFRSQNGGCSKDLEVLESRPTKFRRKLIDLQLPADEYMDTDEEDRFSDDKISAISFKVPNKNCKTMPQRAMFFLDDGGKDGCKTGALKSDTCSRSVNVLDDLNEPVQFEETKERSTSTHVDLLGYNSSNGKTQVFDLSVKPSLQLPCLPKEISFDSYNGCNNSIQNNIFLESRESGKGWFSHGFEAGQSKSNLNTAAHCFKTAKLSMSSQSTQVSLSKLNEPASYLTDKNKVDLREEKTLSGSVVISEGTHNLFNCKNLGYFSATYVPSPCALPTTYDLSKSLSHSISSWENPTSSLSQKSVSVQTHPGFKSSPTLSKSSQSSVQSNGIFGDRWCLNSSARYNQDYGNEMPYQKGFYPGSSSGSKEPSVCLPSVGNENNGAPEYLACHGSTNYGQGPSCSDTKSAKDMNVAFSNSSSKQEVPMLDLESVGREQNHEDHLAVLPWLRAKPTCKIEAVNVETMSKITGMKILQSSVNQSSNKSEITKDSKQLLSLNKKSASSAVDIDTRTELCNLPSNEKLLGFPIFEKPHISKSELSSRYSPVSPLHPTESKLETNSKQRVFDINLPCDSCIPNLACQDATEFEVVENGKEARNASFRQCIDLNSYLSDDEKSLEPSAPSTSVRITAEIDVKSHIVTETDDNTIAGEPFTLKQNETPLESPRPKSRPPQDELMMTAAEAIVAMSSLRFHNNTDQTTCVRSTTILKDSSLVNPLTWFVDIVSSCANDLESRFYDVMKGKDSEDNEKYSLEETDCFECMTLKLTETKEEDYMPKPLIPEKLKLEETGTTFLTNRPRRGHARRGRQRRDFQRDILPGLASLSRHEVTEDLQTFGGLMQATGHSWHSGLTRRNSTRRGNARGRRQSVVTHSLPVATCPLSTTTLMQQLNNLEVGLEDINLAGWGKTTRRPRRQRFPSVNPVSFALT